MRWSDADKKAALLAWNFRCAHCGSQDGVTTVGGDNIGPPVPICRDCKTSFAHLARKQTSENYRRLHDWVRRCVPGALPRASRLHRSRQGVA